MTTKLETFDFEESPVRTLMRDESPWFVLRDVCEVLGIKNSRDAGSRLDADEKGVALTDTRGGQQNTIIINESGLYTLILRCDDAIKPGTTAYRFRKWVTSEVLPVLRQTGVYVATAGVAEVLPPKTAMEAVRELLLTSACDVRDKKLDVGRAQQIANLAARYLEAIKLEGDAIGYEKVLRVPAVSAAGGVLQEQGQGVKPLQSLPQRSLPQAASGEAGLSGAADGGETEVERGESCTGEDARAEVHGEGDLS